MSSEQNARRTGDESSVRPHRHHSLGPARRLRDREFHPATKLPREVRLVPLQRRRAAEAPRVGGFSALAPAAGGVRAAGEELGRAEENVRDTLEKAPANGLCSVQFVLCHRMFKIQVDLWKFFEY